MIATLVCQSQRQPGNQRDQKSAISVVKYTAIHHLSGDKKSLLV